MQEKRNFIARQEKFICENCGEINEILKTSYRNHCKSCLHSKHVDKTIPGDRKSVCKGLMVPVSIDKSGKKGWIIYHKCKKCGKIISNKAAPDDNFDKIIQLSIINEQSGSKKTRKQII